MPLCSIPSCHAPAPEPFHLPNTPSPVTAAAQQPKDDSGARGSRTRPPPQPPPARLAGWLVRLRKTEQPTSEVI